MEFFKRAKVFRLKCSHHSKYLIADEDEERVKQSRDSSSNRARWIYELVEGKPNVIRLRSSWNYRYLAASEDPFLLGMTGKKVLQTISQGPILEWEPIKEGPYIRLKSHTGSFLRANPRVPPWRNSVTHDEPGNWAATDNMILWIVDIVEIDYQSTEVDIGGSTKSMEETRVSSVSSLSSDIADQKSMSMLATLEDEFDDTKSEETSSATVSGCSLTASSEHIQPEEVTMAKQTLNEVKDMEFRTILSSERGESLEKAVKVLIVDAKMSSQDRILSDLLILQEQLKAMKNEHDSASQDLVRYNTFSTRRLKITAELREDAAKARELEAFQVQLETARNIREELLKQLDEVDDIIREAEQSQADNAAEVEELILRMGQKSQILEEMKCEEESWQVRKTEANRMLERVEEEWVKVKTMFPDD